MKQQLEIREYDIAEKLCLIFNILLVLVLLNGLRVLLLTRLDNDKNEQPVAFSSRKWNVLQIFSFMLIFWLNDKINLVKE